jgi:tRNA(Arg) A34 adenosine deaminase TadA
MAMSDHFHLRRAIELALEHSRDGSAGPFGALVVHKGEVVGEGWNSVVETHDPTAHAEVLAIREAAKRLGTHVLEDCTIYSSCEPCPMCLSAIYWARIGRVVYAASGDDAKAAGFDDTIIARELNLAWGERSIEVRQALEEEGREVLDLWRRNPLKRGY